MLKTAQWICTGLFILSNSYASKIDSINALHQALINSSLSCEQYILNQIDTIKRYDLDTSRGAPLNAIVSINPNALEQARGLDQWQLEHRTMKGPLHCVPVTLKNNINNMDMAVENGSLSMLGSRPIQDAVIVKKLRNAGAIFIASTSMDEFASGIFGISSLSGRTGNAYNPLKNSGGSSGGSAVAVASGFALVGIGSDNSGSVRIPAAFNGLYGLRPSYEESLNEGVFPRGYLDGTYGTMTRSIEDMKTVMAVIQESRSRLPPIKKRNRIGLITSVNKTNLDLSPYKSFITQLKTLGFDLVPIAINDFNNDRQKNRSGEVEAINDYLSRFPSTRKNFKDICLSNRTQVFGDITECLHFASTNSGMASKENKQVREMIDTNRNHLESLMDANHLSAMLVPINHSGIAEYDLQQLYIASFALSSNSGLPSMAIPFAYNRNGLPMSIEMLARYRDEESLYQIINDWESQYAKRNYPALSVSNQNLSAWSIARFNLLKTVIGWMSYQNYLGKKQNALMSPQQMNEVLIRAMQWMQDS